MQELKDNKIIIGFSFLYIALSAYLVWTDLTFLVLAPIGLMAIYFAIFHTEYMYLAIAFLTPLSINIEEFKEVLYREIKAIFQIRYPYHNFLY